jgi:hypothetical protein
VLNQFTGLQACTADLDLLEYATACTKVLCLQAQTSVTIAEESLEVALKNSTAALEAVQALSPHCSGTERERAVARVASTQKELANQRIKTEECHEQLQAAEAEAADAAKGMRTWISPLYFEHFQ